MLGRNPWLHIILASYSASLAEVHSRAARNYVQEPLYKQIFPDLEMREDIQRVEEWGVKDKTGQKGGMVAVGIGGSVVGKGSHLLIVDDPHKNRAEVESPVIREGVKTSYTNDLLSRFNDSNKAAQIVMAQRYHTDDLIGWLLDTQKGKWVHLRLPALAEDDDPLGREHGESLWPERFNEEALEEKRIELGSYAFASQYQQRPIPKGEAVFEVDKIEIIDHAPPTTRIVRYYDLAVSTKTRADYTVGLKLGITDDQDLIVFDVFRDKVKAPVLLDKTHEIAVRDGKEVAIALELEKSGISQLDYMLSSPKFAGYTMSLNPIKGDKFTRALAVMTRVNNRKVKLMRGAWNKEFLDELSVFPSGRHDDQVDAFSGAYDFATIQVLPIFDVNRIGQAEAY
jgi:predicted phage terminase large subunit-like protein